VETKKDAIVIYLPHKDADSVIESLRPLLPEGKSFPPTFKVERRLEYTPMMQFVLRDEKRRLFSVDRWCFRGSIDNWFPLAGAGNLPQLVEKYTRHLGKESFFELM
jgi:hypothetical protein